MDVSVPVLVLTDQDVIQQSALGIIRSLGKLGIPVYSTVTSRVGPTSVSRYLRGSFPFEIGSWGNSAMVQRLATIGEEFGGHSVLVSTNDFAAGVVAEHSEQLKKWFLFPRVAQGLPRRLANKNELHSICRSVGVPSPKAVFPRSIEELVGSTACWQFPVVLKAHGFQMRPKLVRSVKIVGSPQELVDLFRQYQEVGCCEMMIQEYIPEECSEDWIVHGYVNPQTNCVVLFTGKKLRSYPPFAGPTSLGLSVRNEPLMRQAESLLKSISYAGILDLDYRLDKRDDQYKLLDFNPRIGANFRMFEDQAGNDVARALYLDLTGNGVRRLPQVEGRVLIVEPQDLFASFGYARRGKLTLRSWYRSLKGRRELAWFRWDDPMPFLMMCLYLVLRKAGQIVVVCRARLHRVRFRLRRETIAGQGWTSEFSTRSSGNAKPIP